MNTCVCVCTCIIVDIIIITNSLLFHFTVDTRLCITYSKNNKECCAIDCKESRWSPVCDCLFVGAGCGFAILRSNLGSTSL